jgi:mono/diheme cytochrome c family protein
MTHWVLAAILGIPAAQDLSRSTVDGVYSPSQAERGRQQYELTCQACHAPDLSGGVGSALKGETFITAWTGLPLARLFERIRTMPPDSPAPLADAVVIDVLAYVLAENAFPPGEPLSASQIGTIRFGSGRESDAPPESGLVLVFGCVERGADGGWHVSRATAPVRTRNPDSSPADERARMSPPGEGGTFRLLNAYPSPERVAGHFVEVKGFLIRGPIAALNVTAMASVTPTCP